MPRRYHAYAPEFQVMNVMSTAGASILGVGYLMPLIYFIWSLKYGEPPTESLESHRPGVANAVAATRTISGYSDGDRRALRLRQRIRRSTTG